MRTTCQSTIRSTRSWLPLPALAVILAAATANLGAADFVNFRDGSWFGPTTVWNQPGIPATGDNVTISHHVFFDSTSVGESVTVSNLTLANNGYLELSGPATLTLGGSNSVFLATNQIYGVLANQGCVSEGDFSLFTVSGGAFENLRGGTYNFAGDGSVAGSQFVNHGLVRKSAGTGTSFLNGLVSQGGTIQVDSGTMVLTASLAGSDCTFTVASNAVADLTGGSVSTWAGQLTGSGAGQVRVQNGTWLCFPGAGLNFPAGLFQWLGGTLNGYFTNTGALNISGGNSHSFTSAGPGTFFYNRGLVEHTNAGALSLSGGIWAQFFNQAAGTYDFAGDGNVSGDGIFHNAGLLRKSGGSSSVISAGFNNEGGTIEVDSGTLSLSGGGNSVSGSFNVAAGALLDLTGGNNPFWSGQITGSGAGQVQLTNGTLRADAGLGFNFPPGVFQWTGGTVEGFLTNLAALVISGGNPHYFTGAGPGTFFYNRGLVQHINAGALNLSGGGYANFYNQAAGTYDFAGDGSINSDGTFYNAGLVRKSSGASSVISCLFNNQGGTIEVDSGTLSLSGSGSSAGGIFNISAGAVLDLTGGASPNWSGQISGSGAGQVQLNSGTLLAYSGLALNCSPGLFQWTGGVLNGYFTNTGTLQISGASSHYFTSAGPGTFFYNQGLVQQLGTGALSLSGGGYAQFYNQAPGTYEISGEGNINSSGAFNNAGLLRKSSGTNSVISCSFNNQNGSIEVDGGTLTLSGNNYSQGAGALNIKLGGLAAGQSGQLAVSGSATLGGPLNVTLTGGFAPAPGNQFLILSSASLSGAFTSLNVPAGIAVTYSNNSVFLVVTGTVPAQIVGPSLNGTNFTFSFGTVSNQSYTVQRNDDLNTTNWVYYTNFTGNGSVMQVLTPVANVPQRFFRVRQP